MATTIETGQATDVGRVRSQNEDSLLTLELSTGTAAGSPPCCLIAVADGLGGYEGGEIASSLAISSLSEKIRSGIDINSLSRGSAISERANASALLADAVREANQRVFNEARGRYNNMATTLVAALTVGEHACIANVGDSRAYLFDEGVLRRVSKDHSLVEELVTAGQIKPDDVYTHPRRNIITRCLGTDPLIEVDLFTAEMKSGSALLLCSDGLWEMLRDNELQDILLSAGNVQSACDLMIEQANAHGGIDNIAVVILRVL